MMTKRTVPTHTVPSGAYWDPDLTVSENAIAAFSIALVRAQMEMERGLKLGLRKSFAMHDLPGEVMYLARYPRVPLVEIDSYLVGFRDHTLALVERCSDCGEEIRLHAFTGLSGFGEALSRIDADNEPFSCRDCQYKTALKDFGRKGKP